MVRSVTSAFERQKRACGWITLALKSVLVCCLIVSPRLAMATDEPEKLQKQAIQRIEQYRVHYYQTGERDSLRPLLAEAEGELKSSYETFLAKSDFATAALSAIQLGKIENIRSVESLSFAGGPGGIKAASAQSVQTHNEAAVRFYSTARDLAQKAGHAGNQAEALLGLARTDGLDRGNLSDALDDVTDAIRLATKAGNDDDVFDALALAAELELKRGRLAAASTYIDRAMAIRQRVNKRLLVYFAYSDRADIYRNRGMVCTNEPRFELCYQALKLAGSDLASALQIAQELGYHFLAQQSQNGLGEINILQQLTQKSEQLLKDQAYLFAPKLPKDVLVSEHFASGPSPNLAAAMKQVSGITSKPDALYYSLQGQIAETQGNNDAALMAYQKSLELLEEDRRQLRDEESRGTFLEDKIEYYYAPSMLLLDRHRYADAFALLERSRSRSLADLLSNRSLNLGSAKERGLFSEREQLRASIGAEQQKVFRFSAAGPEKHAADIAQAEIKIKKLEADEQVLTTRIANEAPRLGKLTTSSVVTMEAAQSMARAENYDLLYYLVLQTGFIVWHIGGDEVEVFKVFLPRAFLIDKVQKLRASLTEPAHNEGAKFDEQTSRELFLFLIQPVLRFIKTKHLVIVPHEDLTYVPFQALQDPSSGSFVAENFQVSYAPSATILDLLTDKPRIKDGRLLAVANPSIEAARTEVKTIGRLYPGRSKIVADTPISKEDLKTWVATYNLVHLSVHGQFEESDPLLSYLELNSASPQKGRLTAAEMFGLPLPRGSMVVLSACETGRVTATHANELLGMERALLYAGASDLVLSAWEVDADSTALWMENFYREAQRASPAEAARLASLAVKARPEYRHPYYWSPFLLTGK